MLGTVQCPFSFPPPQATQRPGELLESVHFLRLLPRRSSPLLFALPGCNLNRLAKARLHSPGGLALRPCRSPCTAPLASPGPQPLRRAASLAPHGQPGRTTLFSPSPCPSFDRHNQAAARLKWPRLAALPWPGSILLHCGLPQSQVSLARAATIPYSSCPGSGQAPLASPGPRSRPGFKRLTRAAEAGLHSPRLSLERARPKRDCGLDEGVQSVAGQGRRGGGEPADPRNTAATVS